MIFLTKIKIFISSVQNSYAELRQKIKNEIDDELFEVLLFEDKYKENSAVPIQPRKAYLDMVEESHFTILLAGSAFSQPVNDEVTHSIKLNHPLFAYVYNGEKDELQQHFIETNIKDYAIYGHFDKPDKLSILIKQDLLNSVKKYFYEGWVTVQNKSNYFENRPSSKFLNDKKVPCLRVFCANRVQSKIDAGSNIVPLTEIAMALPYYSTFNERLSGTSRLIYSPNEPICEINNSDGCFEIVFDIGFELREIQYVNDESIIHAIESTIKLAKLIFSTQLNQGLVFAYRLENCIGRSMAISGMRCDDRPFECLQDSPTMHYIVYLNTESVKDILKKHGGDLADFFNYRRKWDTVIDKMYNA